MAAASPWCQGVPRLLLLSLGLLLLAPAPTPCSSLDFEQLLAQLVTGVAGQAYQNGELELLDHYCSYTSTPHFYRWKMYFRAQVWCPGWTPIVGLAKNHRNSVTARIEATKDFVRKIVDRGLVTREEAQSWL